MTDSTQTTDPAPPAFVEVSLPPPAGETLAERMSRVRRLPLPDALDFVDQAAAALAAAHDRGRVHGRLVADSLFLAPDVDMPRGERVELRDLPPGPAPGDPRTDVRALAAILYDAVCGLPPVVPDTPPPRAFESEIPVHVDAAIVQALAHRPDERFASMRAFAAALRGDLPMVSRARRALRLGVLALSTAAGIGLGALWLRSSHAIATSLRARRAAVTTLIHRVHAPSPPAAAPAPFGARPVIVPLPSEPARTAGRKPLRPAAPHPAAGIRKPAPSPGRAIIDGDELWGRRH